MPNVTSLGVGSGIDAEGIISSLMSYERRPLTLLQTEASGISTQLSSVGKLQGLTATMRDKAAAITASSLWSRMIATPADTSVLTATTSSSAAAGRYSVAVGALAQSQTAASRAFPTSSSTLNAGQLTIELGSWTGGSVTPPTAPTGFTPKAGATPVVVDIGLGQEGLEAIRDQINAAGAGVTATIVNDASGARLSIRSDETGEENGFRISATETVDDGVATDGLSALAFDPLGTSNMTVGQYAMNATATINGIEVESASNTLENVSDGLSLTLLKPNTTVEVVVTNDTASVNTAIKDFVTAYNELSNYIRDQTAYNAETKTAQPLQGERTVVGFQSQLRGVINEDTSASSEWSRLSDIGLEMNKDGTLSIDQTKLDEALTDLPELRKALATDGTDTESSGFMDRYKDLGTSVLAFDGSLETYEGSLRSRLDRNNDRQDQMETRLDQTEKRLRAQYESLDTMMAKLNSLSTYVTTQLLGSVQR